MVELFVGSVFLGYVTAMLLNKLPDKMGDLRKRCCGKNTKGYIHGSRIGVLGNCGSSGPCGKYRCKLSFYCCEECFKTVPR